MKHADLTGKRFGKLSVLEQLERIENGRHYYKYICICDCGRKIETRGENLRSGRVKSCGCLRHEYAANRIENREDAILMREYSAIKKRNRKFSNEGDIIDFETFKRIVNSKCHYCGDIGTKRISDRLRARGSIYQCSDCVVLINGIDRIDSTRGYIVGNCIPCCKTCNYAKNTMTLEQFRNWIKKVHKNFITGKKACKRIDAEQRQLTLF